MAKTKMCDPDLLERDLSGRRVIVTGANSGIGFITAKQLAKQGARVTLACRKVSEGEAKKREILEEVRGADLEVRALDLADLASVRAFAEDFKRDHDALHLLINNAGVMNTPEGKTKDGFEMQFGVNHLGHFLLTELLTDTLKASAPSRVVILSSCFHDVAMGREGKIDLEDLNFETRKYDGWEAYAQSKLANVLHAKVLAKNLADDDVSVASVHPGWVRTNLSRHSGPSFLMPILNPIFDLMGQIDPWSGTQATLQAALSDDVEPGGFYSQVGRYRDKSKNPGGFPLKSPNPQAHDDELAVALFEKSKELVGLSS